MAKTENSVKESNSNQQYKAIERRLNRIIGQINGVKKMIEQNKECSDVLIQMSAIISSLKSTEHAIFSDYFVNTALEQAKNGNNEVINSTLDMIKKL